MTTEQKATAYDKAVEKIKYVMEHGVSPVLNKEDLQDIFPQLKESEDAKIRKIVYGWINTQPSSFFDLNGLSKEDMLAWLQKQSEQREQLINKACDLLVYCIEDFMFRRMEIWDEEGKRKTLENIRKKLEE